MRERAAARASAAFLCMAEKLVSGGGGGGSETIPPELYRHRGMGENVRESKAGSN